MQTSFLKDFSSKIRGLNMRLWVAGIVACAAIGTSNGQSVYTTPYAFSTLAGSPPSLGSNDGTGSAARFQAPQGVAVDSSGNVFVADFSNQTIRKVTSGGVVTTFAGTAGSAGSTDGTGAAARFNGPAFVAVDGSGNLYVSDYFNHTIRKITSAGVVTTLAGSPGSSGSTDATGSAARFSFPAGVAVDAGGNVYVADSGNHTIRKITSGGVVTTLAGSAGSSGTADGTGVNVRFNTPIGVAVDSSGNVYVGDSVNHTIRKVTSGGTSTTLAGTAGSAGSADGTGAAARFQRPQGVTVDATGNVYAADYANHTLRKITSGGVVTTLAGSAGVFGTADGTGSAARFYFPMGVSVDSSTGTVYVGDNQNFTIRKVTSVGVVTTLAGTPPYGFADGLSAAAGFNFPSGVAADSTGTVYVSDTYNHSIRKITPAGAVTTLAGTSGALGSADGTGSAARFNLPQGLAVDGSGNVYVADYGNHTIRKITSGGVVTTLAGTAGSSGSTDATGAAARFNNPRGVAVDGSGNVYVADFGNHTIRKITSGGVVTTLAGTAGSLGSTDATGAAARFAFPHAVAVDGAGNVYVADTANCTIRKITPGGVVTTLAGTAGTFGSTDGTGGAARFDNPAGIAVTATGTVFVADFANDIIRKVTAAGVVSTVAGLASTPGSTDGAGQVARFKLPQGIAVNSSGILFVADTDNNEVRRGIAGLRGDFNSDGYKDILWENTTTGERAIWLMQGTVYQSAVSLGILSTDWRIAGAADFNGDGQTDILFENTVTGDRMIWIMNGTAFVTSIDMGIVPTVWRIAACADFNGDGQTDIMVENTSTGERVLWLMNGPTVTSTLSYGVVSTDWRIAAASDFNHDGQIDIVWANKVNGDHAIWLMNGTVFQSAIDFGVIPTQWQLTTIGDFNGDGNADFFWQNTVTGDRALWIMVGTVWQYSVFFGTIPIQWNITP